MEIALCDKQLHKEGHSSYLWIGEGLYNQRLFYVDGKDELREDQAYYFKGNRGRVIRMVDYE